MSEENYESIAYQNRKLIMQDRLIKKMQTDMIRLTARIERLEKKERHEL